MGNSTGNAATNIYVHTAGSHQATPARQCTFDTSIYSRSLIAASEQLCHFSYRHMNRRPYPADLIVALQKTVSRMTESGDMLADDPAMRKLKKSLVLKIAEQALNESKGSEN